MRCTSPRTAWVNPQGGRPLFGLWSGVEPGREFLIACGKCFGCSLDKSSDWALRAQHEARYFDRKSFLTLTFNDEHLPESPEAARREINLFQKRFRKHYGAGHRFFGAMELGERNKRIHAHLLVYGEDFRADAFPVPGGSYEHALWSNPVLQRLWPFGFSSVGELNEKTAAYVAGYVCAKATRPRLVSVVHPVTGEVRQWPTLYRPFYPSRPALGIRFFDDFAEDVWSGLRARGGARLRTPAAYSKRMKVIDPDRYEQAVEDRIVAVTEKRDLYEESEARQAVKDEVQRAAFKAHTKGRS